MKGKILDSVAKVPPRTSWCGKLQAYFLLGAVFGYPPRKHDWIRKAMIRAQIYCLFRLAICFGRFIDGPRSWEKRTLVESMITVGYEIPGKIFHNTWNRASIENTRGRQRDGLQDRAN